MPDRGLRPPVAARHRQVPFSRRCPSSFLGNSAQCVAWQPSRLFRNHPAMHNEPRPSRRALEGSGTKVSEKLSKDSFELLYSATRPSEKALVVIDVAGVAAPLMKA